MDLCPPTADLNLRIRHKPAWVLRSQEALSQDDSDRDVILSVKVPQRKNIGLSEAVFCESAATPMIATAKTVRKIFFMGFRFLSLV
jgi:hypothetical protein